MYKKIKRLGLRLFTLSPITSEIALGVYALHIGTIFLFSNVEQLSTLVKSLSIVLSPYIWGTFACLVGIGKCASSIYTLMSQKHFYRLRSFFCICGALLWGYMVFILIITSTPFLIYKIYITCFFSSLCTFLQLMARSGKWITEIIESDTKET